MAGRQVAEARDRILVNCNVVDGTNVDARRDQGVWIRDDAIEAVGQVDDVMAEAGPDGAEVLDLAGAYVMPGLINMHVHLGLKLPGSDAARLADENVAQLSLRMASNANAGLLAGVTTVRLVGESDHADFALRGAIERGEVAGPRIFTAGMAITCTGGHGHAAGTIESDGPGQIRRNVRNQIKAGADFIKVMASGGIAGEFEGASGLQLEEDELQALIRVAHAWGKKVAAHAGPAEVIRIAIDHGLDCVEHGYGLTPEVCGLMAERGTLYVPTLSVTRCADFFARIEAPPWMVERALEMGPRHLESLEHALNGGVAIALGTDMLPAEPYDGTSATVREMEHMVEGGMSPLDVLVAATARPAEWLRADDRLGSVEPGKHADLIAMPDDPIRDVGALRGVGFVMKGGEVFRNDLGTARLGRS